MVQIQTNTESIISTNENYSKRLPYIGGRSKTMQKDMLSFIFCSMVALYYDIWCIYIDTCYHIIYNFNHHFNSIYCISDTCF